MSYGMYLFFLFLIAVLGFLFGKVFNPRLTGRPWLEFCLVVGGACLLLFVLISISFDPPDGLRTLVADVFFASMSGVLIEQVGEWTTNNREGAAL